MMKFKRLVAMALLVGMLCSFAVPMAFAENGSIYYDFKLQVGYEEYFGEYKGGTKLSEVSDLLTSLYPDVVNWNYEDSSNGMDQISLRLGQGLRIMGEVGDWQAFRLSGMKAGNYDIALNTTATNSANTVDIYLAKAVEGMNIAEAMTAENLLLADVCGTNTISNVSITMEDGEYILIVSHKKVGTNGYWCLTGMDMLPLEEAEETTAPEQPPEDTYVPETTQEATIPYDINGVIGDNLAWNLNTEGTLTISGKGNMFCWSRVEVPWLNEQNFVKKVVIESGVTSIGSNAFYNWENLSCVVIPASVTQISGYAFDSCSSLTDVHYMGLEEQWNQIQIYENNEALIGANIHYEGNANGQMELIDPSYYPESDHNYSSNLNDEKIFTWPGARELKVTFSQDTYTEWNYDYIILRDGSDNFIGSYCGDMLAGQTIIVSGDTLKIQLNSDGGGEFFGYSISSIVANMSQLTELSIKNLPMRSQYFLGEPLNTTGLVLSAAYSDGTTEDVFNGFTVSDFINTVPGTKEMTVFYRNMSVNFVLEVRDIALSNIMLDVQNAKTEYKTGEMLDISGVSVYAVGADGTSEKINGGFNISGFDNQSSGTKTVTITYGDFSASYEVNVICGGVFGENLNWILEDGTLTISGTGSMGWFNNAYEVPWYNFHSEIENVVIAEGVTNIGQFAFYGCENLKNITIADTVTAIGSNVFCECYALKEIVIPAGVSEIDTGTFWACDNLMAIRVAEDNPYYSSDAYGVLYNKNKSTLVKAPSGITGSYVVPEGVTCIYWYAFHNCQKLTEVTIANSVTKIEGDAFANCIGLTSVTIPENVSEIGETAFNGCSSMTAFYVDNANAYFSSNNDGVLFDKNKTVLLTVPKGLSGSFEVPAGVLQIAGNAFADCYQLTDVIISNSVTEIEYRAFSSCRNLHSVTIPNGVTTINTAAFVDCESLTAITLPNSITTFGEAIFDTCQNLRTIYLEGTSAQWSAIDLMSAFGSGASIVYLDDAPTLESFTFAPISIMESNCGQWENGVYVYDILQLINNTTFTAVFEDETEISSTGTGLFYNGCWYEFNVTANQSSADPWIGGNTYNIAVSLLGQTAEFAVTIEASPLASLEIAPVSTVVGTGGYWNRHHFGPNEYEEYYYYSPWNLLSLTTYTATFADGQVLSGSGSGFNYNGNYYEFQCEIPEQDYFNQWSAGNTYHMTVTVLGKQLEVPITLTPSPVVSLEFTPVSVMENSCGSMDNEWNPETGNNDLMYFRYSEWDVLSQSNYIITFADGTSASGKGNSSFSYNGQWYSFDISSNQDYYNQWTIGNTYTINVSVMGQRVAVPVTITGSPVASIEFTPVSVIEGNFGSWSNEWNPENGNYDLRYFRYNVWEILNQSQYTVTFSDGTVCSGNGSNSFYYNGQWYGFSNYYNQDYYNQWTVGNTYTVTMSAMGKSCDVQISIVPSPLVSLEFSPVSILEETCGWWNEYMDENGQQMQYYYYNSWELRQKSTFTATFSDGTVITGNAADDFEYDGKWYSFNTIEPEQNADNCWIPGNTYCFTCTAMGQSGEIAVTICEPTISGGYAYVNNNGQATITGCILTDTILEIPETIDGLPVVEITSLGQAAETAEEIIIPDSVCTIGQEVFSYNEHIKRVTLGNGITEIDRFAFEGCLNLEAVIFSNAVTGIGEGAFRDCHSLQTIQIPESVTWIGHSAFRDCSSLQSVTIPENVLDINSYAFRGCISLSGIWVDENNPCYTSDEFGVLFNDDMSMLIQAPGNLTGNYTIPESVMNVKGYAFENCPNLTGIFAEHIGDNFSTDSHGVLFSADKTVLRQYPGGLTGSYTIPEGVMDIDDRAFLYCSGLTGITIPDSVTYIGDCAFWGCSGLTELVIPNSVNYIADAAFSGCSGLEMVTVPYVGGTRETDDEYRMHFGYIFGTSEYEGSVSTDPYLYKYYIPASLKTVTVTGGNLRYADFWGCCNVESITLPDSVTTISDYAFEDCVSLQNVNIPAGVTYIGECAFSDCESLTELTIPEKVSDIGWGAFWDCTGLTELVIPDSVTYIDDYAFYNCNALTDITLSENLNRIGESAFSDCYSLQSISIPESVESIGWGAFWDCTGLKRIEIPEGVTSLGDYAFVNCYELQEVVLPGSITTIGESTFSDCYALESIVIPEGITRIGWGAFWDCGSLQSIYIPESLTSFGDFAFVHCYGLFYVYYAGTQKQWDRIEKGINDELNWIVLSCKPCQHEAVQDGACADCGETIGSVITDKYGNTVAGFVTLTEAVAAAQAGQTLEMSADAAIDDLVLPQGVALDLNGNTLAVNTVLTYSSGAIVDSSADGSGLLKVSDPEGIMINADNPQMPIYDSANGGLRFFEIQVSTKAVTGKNSGNPKYWLQIEVTNFDRFNTLIQADAEMEIRVKMSWDGQEEPVYAAAMMEFTKKWAKKYQENKSAYVTVSLDDIQDRENFKLIPCVGANGVEISEPAKCQDEESHNYQDGICRDCGACQLDYGTWTAIYNVTEETLDKLTLRCQESLFREEYRNIESFDGVSPDEVIQWGGELITIDGRTYTGNTGGGDSIYYEYNGDEVIFHLGEPADNWPDQFTVRRYSENQMIVTAITGCDFYGLEVGMILTCQE